MKSSLTIGTLGTLAALLCAPEGDSSLTLVARRSPVAAARGLATTSREKTATQKPALQFENEAQYLAALWAADSSTFQREFESEFVLLLDSTEQQKYMRAPMLTARKAFVAQYWKAANPNPLMPENDWLLDFLHRRSFARKNFPAPEPPFVDDRGKYYLKYGKPWRRYEDFGTLDVLANETWSYENVMHNFVVHFKREGRVYREVQNLVEILSGRKRYDPDTEAKVMIAVARQRASVSPVFGRVFSKWLDLNSAQMHAESFPTSHTALAIEWQQPHAILFAAAQHAKAELAYARSLVPPSAHDAIRAVNALTMQMELTQFRAERGETRLDIAVRAPFQKNLLPKKKRAEQMPLQLEYRARFADAEYNVIDEASATSTFARTDIDWPNAVGRLVLTAKPQSGDLVVQLKAAPEERLGFVRQNFSVRDFSGTQLMLSEVQLLMEVTTEQQQLLPTMMKQERLVAPYPFDDVRKTLPLLCYFEIYNLQAARYELTYEVTAMKSRGRAEQTAQPAKNAATISVTATRTTTTAAAEELLALDLGQLPHGVYALDITVTEAGSPLHTVHAQKLFVIAD